MKLDVGMYVRHDGRIFKLDEYNIKGWKKFFEIVGTDNFQSSHNIIDLMEVGDYVNGSYIQEIISIKNNEMKCMLDSDYELISTIKNEDIETILTKEQFSQMEYKVV